MLRHLGNPPDCSYNVKCINNKKKASRRTWEFAETGNWKQATTEYKQQLWGGASHMSEQRRGLGDARVLAVPAEYAGASSGSGDHPQQYYLQRPKLTTLEEKDIFLIFFIGVKKIYFTMTHLSDIISPD